MDAICVRGRVGLLLGSEHLALTDGIDRSVGVFSVLREGGYVKEVNGYLHGPGHICCNHKNPAIRTHLQLGRHVKDRCGLLCTLDAVRVVPVQAPFAFIYIDNPNYKYKLIKRDYYILIRSA